MLQCWLPCQPLFLPSEKSDFCRLGGVEKSGSKFGTVRPLVHPLLPFIPQSSVATLTATFCTVILKAVGFLTMGLFQYVPLIKPIGFTLIMSRASRRPCQSTLHNSLATFLCSPIEHAFAPQPKYQFTLRLVQSSTPQPPIPIDPALLPLPRSADLDLRDGPTIANAIGLKRAEKHAEKRSANYSKEDVHKMFNLVAELLPVGQKGWKEVEQWYNKWAKQNGRAERPPKALKNKYKQYLRQKKPTGSGSCPPEVKCAHEIEDLINQLSNAL
ncbi:hypothetical protein B0H14DRAFT_2582766 [Mycena olivaceomarginata]|nr:hypothetical protein B0H14DRAFT_2582766 [Mycena olivaceomarginata]